MTGRPQPTSHRRPDPGRVPAVVGEDLAQGPEAAASADPRCMTEAVRPQDVSPETAGRDGQASRVAQRRQAPGAAGLVDVLDHQLLGRRGLRGRGLSEERDREDDKDGQNCGAGAGSQKTPPLSRAYGVS